MKRLTVPTFDPWTTTSLASGKFAGTALSKRVSDARADLSESYREYQAASLLARWYQLKHCEHGKDQQVVISALSKSDFKALYSSGFVQGLADARDIYDQIKVAAAGRCPYCSFGEVDPLDHFLSKSRYPQYSVYPPNLVPCCDKCNKLSGSAPFQSEFDQTIHPYFDDDIFFNEPWVSVRFQDENLLSYVYFFDSPVAWSEVDKRRAKCHFRTFKLAARYASVASQEVSYISEELRHFFELTKSSVAIKSLLERKSANQKIPINGWVRPLYRALAQSDWYI